MERAHDESRTRDEARAGLRGELREVVGDEAAARAERKGALDAALDADRPRTVASVLSQYRSLLMIGLFTALIVGAVIALITGTWWWLLVALLLHGIGTAVVVTTALTMATQTESTDPRTAAALQARGVTDPDAALSQAVDAAAEESDSGEAQEARRRRTEITPSPRSEPTGGPPQHAKGRRA
jgi:hypothetical protein